VTGPEGEIVMKNAINWFEIFVSDLDRATGFYQKVLGVDLRREDFGGMPMAVFPYQGGVGGALVRNARRSPGDGGSLVYIDATGKLDACLERVAAAGGSVLTPKTDIGDPGFIALLRDSEGNTVGLHSGR
jgi:predicted enzyme related to lactoylglutathione lyase